MVDMTALGLHKRQMFIITSYVESREMNEANVYCLSAHDKAVRHAFCSCVCTQIALGMTNAVIFFSIVCHIIRTGLTTRYHPDPSDPEAPSLST